MCRLRDLLSGMIILCAMLLTSACSSDSAGNQPAPADKVPLSQAVSTLPDKEIWGSFQQITQVPRESHHEEKISAFLASFGRSLGLETIVDAVGNVIIRKPATAGMEKAPVVVLQAHMDMVAQKSPGSTFNFATDPITAYIANDWVFADGTPLGGDDGIGVAIIMTLLQSKSAVHGPIEAVFTVDEEADFTGINNLSSTVLRGRTYINVDFENEGQFCISSAGGVYVDSSRSYGEAATPAGMSGLQVTVDGLTGGHSGIDIGKGGASAHQLLAQLLVEAPSEYGVRVSSIAGGNQSNAIPRTAKAVVALPSAQVAAFENYTKSFAAKTKEKLTATDPGVTVTTASAPLPAKVMESAGQQALIGAVYAQPQGVYRMSSDVPGLVETSGNNGILTIGGGSFFANVYVRSAIDSERDAEAERFAAVYRTAGATVTESGVYSSWPPNQNSAILNLMKGAYRDLFSKEPAVVAVHAGLETSVAGTKYPDMDMISIGPTAQNVHTTEERLSVSSVTKVYKLLLETLRRIK